jgi:hypothetical protein
MWIIPLEVQFLYLGVILSLFARKVNVKPWPITLLKKLAVGVG